MSSTSATIWVVAGPGTAERWAFFLWMQGRRALSVPWSVIAPSDDPAAAAAAVDTGDHDLLLFTSPNAPQALPAGTGAGRACACVGSWTAQAAGERGFQPVVVGRAGAASLAREVLASQPDARRVLFVRGREARPEAPAILREAGVTVDEVVAYAVDPDPDLARVVAALPAPRVVVFGSPRAVDAVSELGCAFADDVRFVAPGDVTAERVCAFGAGRVFRMERPAPSAASAAVGDALRED